MTGPAPEPLGDPMRAIHRTLCVGQYEVAEVYADHMTTAGDAAIAAEIARRWNAYPDLLAACEVVDKLLAANGYHDDIPTSARGILRTAIAKAKGGDA